MHKFLIFNFLRLMSNNFQREVFYLALIEMHGIWNLYFSSQKLEAAQGLALRSFLALNFRTLFKVRQTNFVILKVSRTWTDDAEWNMKLKIRVAAFQCDILFRYWELELEDIVWSLNLKLMITNRKKADSKLMI